jgi:hypothetical protein
MIHMDLEWDKALNNVFKVGVPANRKDSRSEFDEIGTQDVVVNLLTVLLQIYANHWHKDVHRSVGR